MPPEGRVLPRSGGQGWRDRAVGTVVPAASAGQRRAPLGRAPGPPSRADPTEP